MQNDEIIDASTSITAVYTLQVQNINTANGNHFDNIFVTDCTDSSGFQW